MANNVRAHTESYWETCWFKRMELWNANFVINANLHGCSNEINYVNIYSLKYGNVRRCIWFVVDSVVVCIVWVACIDVPYTLRSRSRWVVLRLAHAACVSVGKWQLDAFNQMICINVIWHSNRVGGGGGGTHSSTMVSLVWIRIAN